MDNREKHFVDSYFSGMTPDEKNKLAGAIRSGSLNDALSAMRPEDAKKARDLVSDRAALEKLLQSPEAQKILKLFKDPGGKADGKR